jgi:cell division GTPase FtsZ
VGVEFICATPTRVANRTAQEHSSWRQRDRAGSEPEKAAKLPNSPDDIRDATGGAHMLLITAGMAAPTGAAPVTPAWP